jgi:GNAT superfamily N-acetyltransferase
MEFDEGISLHTEWTDEDMAIIWNGILDYNRMVGPMLQYPPYEPLNLLLRDADGKIVGGLQSKIYLRCIYIGALWMDEHHRNRGYGARLMAEAERRAEDQGCEFIHLDTFSFQGIGFYLKLGFEVFATLDEYPGGVVRYFLKKRL